MMQDDGVLKLISSLPAKVYVRVKNLSEIDGRAREHVEMVVKLCVFLNDRPGSLAALSSFISEHEGNISFFHYDRSINSSRVAVEVQFYSQQQLEAILLGLKEDGYVFEQGPFGKDRVQITSLESILEIKVRLVNEPGSLAAFANILKEHHANIIYMLYDEDIDAESADIVLATGDLEEIDALLDTVNKRGYHYKVVYRGSGEKEVEHIIGLKMVEKFFLRLRKLLPVEDMEEIKSLVDSSQELYADLVNFYAEAGNTLDAGDVFEKVLLLASRARSSIRDRFSAREMPPIEITTGVILYSFKLPTSENVYIFRQGGEISMIDAGFGSYYEDIKTLLRNRSIDPASMRRIFVTHPDADHAGTAGYFEEEFGTEIFMHPASKGVIDHDNRAYGAAGTLLNLNKYYTRLVNKFTECRFPSRVHHFSLQKMETVGGFKVIDTFAIGPLEFEVLESHGGHIKGHVFFLNRQYGMIFTSDFLINVQSLSSSDKDILGLYRYLLTSPNQDSELFKEEAAKLKDMIKELDESLKAHGLNMMVFPGHGDYYRADSIQ